MKSKEENFTYVYSIFFKGLEIFMYMSKKNILKKTSLVSHAEISVIQDKIWTNIFRYYSSPSHKKILELECHIFVILFQVHKIGTPGSKPFYFCDHCDKVFLREYGLSIHKRNFHSTVPKSLECSYCGKDFKNAKFLKHHEDKHKSGFIEESQNVCPHCAKEFSKSVNLDRHIKITHQKVKNHECHDCGKKFVDR